MRRFLIATILGSALVTVAGCDAPHNPDNPTPTPVPAAAPTVDANFEPVLLRIASEYRSYKLVDESLHVAPQACAAAPPLPVYASMSQSKDQSTHGRKLYRLFTPDADAYRNLGRSSAELIPQAIVKESRSAVPCTGGTVPAHPELASVTDRNVAYQAGEQRDLFIMTRLDPSTPGTDNGWIYGTVTADGKHVTSAGRVESCMSCHADAPHGRLFGLRDTQATARQ